MRLFIKDYFSGSDVMSEKVFRIKLSLELSVGVVSLYYIHLI